MHLTQDNPESCLFLGQERKGKGRGRGEASLAWFCCKLHPKRVHHCNHTRGVAALQCYFHMAVSSIILNHLKHLQAPEENTQTPS